ncbi:MAG: hypothetical protein ACYDCG_19395 [Candidatus Acidiferrales bacterium]
MPTEAQKSWNEPFVALFGPLGKLKKSHWYDSFIWLIYNLAGSLAPVWFGILILKLFSRHPGWADFSDHGEFALYSAAMFAPTFYVISRDLKVPGFTGRQILSLLTLLGLLASTCFFVAVTTAFMDPKPVLEIDHGFLQSGTLDLFVLSVVLSFLVTALDNGRQAPDVNELAAQQQVKLAAQYDALEKPQ